MVNVSVAPSGLSHIVASGTKCQHGVYIPAGSDGADCCSCCNPLFCAGDEARKALEVQQQN